MFHLDNTSCPQARGSVTLDFQLWLSVLEVIAYSIQIRNVSNKLVDLPGGLNIGAYTVNFSTRIPGLT